MLGAIGLEAALDLEAVVGGVEVGGLQLGLAWMLHVPPRKSSDLEVQLVPVAYAPADTLCWMDRAGRIFQDPDYEFCLPLANHWREYVKLYVFDPSIVYAGSFHACTAAVSGYTPETLAKKLGVAVGGMALGPKPAVWTEEITRSYAVANGVRPDPTDGATFSAPDLETFLKIVQELARDLPSGESRLQMRFDCLQPSTMNRPTGCEVLVAVDYHSGRHPAAKERAEFIRKSSGELLLIRLPPPPSSSSSSSLPQKTR